MMYHHPPMLRVLGLVVWLLTAIGALNWGLEALGYNIFNMNFIEMNLASAIMPLKYIIGIAGLISLLMLIEKLINHSHDGKCTC